MVFMSPTHTAKRMPPVSRKSYARLSQVLNIPNLIEVQLDSFLWFQEEGIKQLLEEISPIEDFTGNKLELSFIGGRVLSTRLDLFCSPLCQGKVIG